MSAFEGARIGGAGQGSSPLGNVAAPGAVCMQTFWSAEFHLVELFGFARSAMRNGPYVYQASLDIEDVFDAAPRDRISDISNEPGIERPLFRFVGRWLATGRFKLRPTAPAGMHFSSVF